MARASSSPVKTFSVGFRQADFNEAHYARAVARQFGTEHRELLVEPDIVGTLESLTRSLEEPFADSSMLPTYYVCCLARQHVTVALAGDGGDELFAGYDRYRIHLRRRVFEHIPAWARRWYRDQIFPRLPKELRGRKFAYNVSLPWRERYADSLFFQPAFEAEDSLLSDDFRAAASDPSPLQLVFDYFEKAPARDQLSQMLYVDTKTYLPGDILTKVDRMSMATSLEVRAPILDHVFVEWVTGLAPRWKLRRGMQKYLLRKLAERLGVPREVLYRPKQGFALPLSHWMRNELKALVLDVLLEPRTVQRGYFKATAVRQLLEEHFRGRRDQSHRIWQLLIFELWHRNFLEPLRATTPGLPLHEGVG
jgi:asparagine synthase (glutamine-hydrolysing)